MVCSSSSMAMNCVTFSNIGNSQRSAAKRSHDGENSRYKIWVAPLECMMKIRSSQSHCEKFILEEFTIALTFAQDHDHDRMTREVLARTTM